MLQKDSNINESGKTRCAGGVRDVVDPLLKDNVGGVDDEKYSCIPGGVQAINKSEFPREAV